MSTLADRLRQAMAHRTFKGADITRATGIDGSAISRYLSGENQPSADRVFVLSQYLDVSPDWLQSGSGTPESVNGGRGIPTDKDKIIEVQEELIKNLQKQVMEWEDWKASNKERRQKEREKNKNPTQPTSRKDHGVNQVRRRPNKQ